MAHAVFPGSFDPLTYGHLDIIGRALRMFDRVTVAVLDNPEKKLLFSPEERVAFIESECKKFGKRVQVERFKGLLVDFMRRRKAHAIIRGLRAISDYDYEVQMALMNRSLSGDVETVFLVAREENSFISSSMVKQVALYGGDIGRFVPPKVARALKKAAHERLKL